VHGVLKAMLALGAAVQTAPAGWRPWAYVYLVGGVVFVIGLLLCVQTKQIDLSRRRGRIVLALMLLGFAAYTALQGIMQLVLPRL